MKKGRMKKLLALVLCFLLMLSLVENVGYQPIAEEVLLASASDAELSEATGSTEDAEGVEGTEAAEEGGSFDLQDSLVNGGVIGGSPIAVAQEVTEEESPENEIMTIAMEDGPFSIDSIEIRVNDKKLEDNSSLKNGQDIEIHFDWSLQNNSQQTEFWIDLDTNGIDLTNYTDQWLKTTDGRTVGTWEIVGDQLHVKLNEDFTSESNIFGEGDFRGQVAVKGGSDDTEWNGDLVFGDAICKNVTVDLTPYPSELEVSKIADGSVSESGGKLVQKYKITLRAKNGKVTLNSFEDTWGANLSWNVDDNGVIKADIPNQGQKEYRSWDELKTALENFELEENKEIVIEYSMTVDDSVYGTDQGFNNGVKVKYTDEDDVENKEGSGYANVDVKRPTVNKSGQLIEDNTKVKWTITIDTGDLDWENIDVVKDTLGNYLDVLGDYNLSDLKNQFIETPVGSGIYVFEYETKVSQEALDSPFSERLTNNVEVDISYNDEHFTKDADASVDLPKDQDFLEKDFVKYDKASHKLTWEIKITVPRVPSELEGSAPMTNVTLVDSIGNYADYNHKIDKEIYLNETLIVDSQGQLTEEGSRIIEKLVFGDGTWQTGGNWGIPELTFKDDYIKSMEGKVITLRIVTTATEDSLNADRVTYVNNASLTYNDVYGTEQHEDDNADHSIANVLSKSGKQATVRYNEKDYNKNAVDFTITVDLMHVDNLSAGQLLEIKDILPEHMMYDTTYEPKVEYTIRHSGNVNSTNVQNAPSLDTQPGEEQENGRQQIDFSITIDENVINAMEGFKGWANDSAEGFYINITYRAKVAPEYEKEFLEKGGDSFTNDVTAKLGPEDLGEASATVEVQPSDIIFKEGVYNPDRDDDSVSYTIIVNPDKADLVPNDGFIQVTDEMGSALMFDRGSLKVSKYAGTGDPLTDESGWVELAAGPEKYDYYYTYEVENGVGKLTFKLPDGEALKITYDCKINLYHGDKNKDNNDAFTEDNSYNRVRLEGINSGSASTDTSFQTQLSRATMTATSELASITIYKYWTDGDNMVALTGSTFELHKCIISVDDANNVTITGMEDEVYDKNNATISVDGNGKASASGLAYDNIYALVEIDADEGFSIGEPYYFAVFNKKLAETYNLPEGVDKFFSSGIVNYENIKGENLSIEAQKTLDGSTEELEDEQFQFTIEKGTFDSSSLTFTPDSPDGYSKTVGNSDDGSVKFPAISYGKDDIANNPYYYKISEEPGDGDDGIIYDKSYYIVKVTVSENSDKIGLDVEITKYVWDEGEGKYIEDEDGEWNTKNLSFSNTTEEATGTLVLKKTITGDELLADSDSLSKVESITFTVTKGNETVATKELTSASFAGGATWTETINDLPIGEYTITETVTTANGYVRKTTYTVTVQEEQKGEGTGLVAGNVAIEDGKITTVEFTNEYTEASQSFEAKKTLNDSSTIPDTYTFEFTLERMILDQGALKTDSSFEPKTANSSTGGSINFGSIEYNDGDIGNTYYYKISEKNTAQDNIIYDKTYYIVTVVVNADGLNTTVKKYTDENPGGVSCELSEIVFKNTKTLSTSLNLKAQKTWLDGSFHKQLDGDDFTFYLQEVETPNEQGLSADKTDGKSQSKTNDEDGKVTFDSIVYTDQDDGHTYYYKISEDTTKNKHNDATVDYDDSFYIVEVKINKTGSPGEEVLGKTVTVTKYVKQGDGYIVQAGSWDEENMPFINYTLASDVSLSLEAQKTLHDGTAATIPLAGGEFNFELWKVENSDGTGTSSKITENTNIAGGTVTFKNFATYTEADADANKVYYYKISETPGSNPHKDLHTNILYDESFYIVKVEVTKENNAESGRIELKATPTVTKYVKGENGWTVEDGSWSIDGNMPFDNHVDVKDGSLILTASKTLTGANAPTLQENQFNFLLVQVNADAENATSDGISAPISTSAQNKADGSITFSELTFTKENIGHDYYYKISEQDLTATNPNYAYDQNFYIVTVHVDEDKVNNRAKPTVTNVTKYEKQSNGSYTTSTGDSLDTFPASFENTEYSAQVPIYLSKDVPGASMLDYNGKFTFKLTGGEVGNPNNTTTLTAQNDGTGNVTFLPALTYTGADRDKTFTYTITEVPEGVDGVKYDPTVYKVEVTFTVEGSVLTPVVKYYKVTDGSSVEFTPTQTVPEGNKTLPFVNYLDAEGEVTIDGEKVIRTNGANEDPGKRRFDFEIFRINDDSSETLIGTSVQNDDDGDFSFVLKYVDADLKGTGDDRATTYKYKVVEIEPDDASAAYTYDKTVFTFTVTITDDRQGHIDGVVKYDEAGGSTTDVSNIVFYNDYESIAWPLEASKVFTGNSGYRKGFTFVLERTDADGNPLTGADAYKDTKITGSTGHVTFDSQNATVDGTYYYRIYEEDDESQNNLVYDDTEYRVKVVVADGDYTTSLWNGTDWDTSPEYQTGDIQFTNHIDVGITKANEQGAPVSGASLQIRNSKGLVVEGPWTTNGDVTTFENLVINEIYTLEEVTPPQYYYKAEPIKFCVGEDYKLYIVNANGSKTPVNGNGITMVDEKATVTISKQDAANSAEISGASLEIKNLDGDTIYGPWNTTGAQTVIDMETARFATNTVYVLIETTAPYGYEIAEKVYFKFDENNEVWVSDSAEGTFTKAKDGIVTMIDERQKISVDKEDLTNGEKIDGAKLTITDETGKAIASWTSSKSKSEEIDVLKFEPGKDYTLTEVTAPDGYELAESITFKIDENGDIWIKVGEDEYEKLDSDTIVMKDAPSKFIYISKVDMTNSEELAGASLTVTDSDGNTIDSWKTDGKTHRINTKKFKTGEEYTLTEVTAPNGYEVAESITFKIDENGDIWIKVGEDEYEKLGSDTIVMEDAPTKTVNISKVDMTNSEEIEGASLIITDSNGNEFDSWKTDGSVHKINTKKFVVGEEYTLTEITAPDGYELAESITFKVDENGDIWIKGKSGIFTKLDFNTIVMEDAPSRTIGISKVDMTNSEELIGASLIITDSDGNEVDSWVTNGKVHEINIKKFEVDKEYTLTEITAPDGYEVAESITFKLDEYGSIWIKGADGTFTLLGTDTIVMEDAPTGTSVGRREPSITTTNTTTNTTSAKTGDHTPIAMAIVLLVASAAGLIGLVVRRRKR